MTGRRTKAAPSSAARPAFVTTQWSAVLAAHRSDTATGSDALAKLCQVYWYPLYAYVRRRGYNPEDAQDLTQEFFLRLLHQDWLAQADRERGRFRTFLLAAMSHFLANEWHKGQAQKRGGGVTFVPLEIDNAETRYTCEPADPLTPEQCYEKRWAVALLDEVLNRLRLEFDAEGRGRFFDALKPCLIGDGKSQSYNTLSRELGMTEDAIKVAVHRLRKRYRQLLREEIANTVSSVQEVQAEMRHLLEVLAG